MISFARGVPAPECLAVDELADCARAALERDGRTILSYGPGAIRNGRGAQQEDSWVYLGYLGWGVLGVGAFLGFGYGAVVGIALMAVRRACWSRIPFGPLMVAGALTAVFVGARIAHAYVNISRN